MHIDGAEGFSSDPTFQNALDRTFREGERLVLEAGARRGIIFSAALGSTCAGGVAPEGGQSVSDGYRAVEPLEDWF